MSLTNAVSASSLPQTIAGTAPRLRLHYLDGLRGQAAIAVVLNHARLQSGYHGGATVWEHIQFAFAQMISDGRASVAIFIVLSGYCLMLPVARSSDKTLRGGTLDFLKRRAKRILPPYYAALTLIFVATVFIPQLKDSHIPQWRDALPVSTISAILPHLFLVHNWNPQWFFKIDPPAWTVATEWQIYLVFPPLLLPLWRRCGSLITIFTAFCVGLIPLFGLHHGQGASFWFLGLFAIGMAAAAINFPSQKLSWHARLPWGLLAGFFSVLVMLLENTYLIPSLERFSGGKPDGLYNHYWILDSLVGIATGCFLIYCTQLIASPRSSPKPIILRLLESSSLVFIGSFSYSLYLIHDPILAIAYSFFRRFSLSSLQFFSAMAIFGLFLSLLGAYLFHLAFERRFIVRGPKLG